MKIRSITSCNNNNTIKCNLKNVWNIDATTIKEIIQK